VGRSGSGKTTLLALAAGLLVPTSGRIAIEGVDINSLQDEDMAEFRNRRIGFIPQGQSTMASLTVFDNVRLPHYLSRRRGASPPEIDALLDRLGLAELRDCFPAELSGGEMRRVSLARTLVNRPALILADEPTGDLDPENIAIVMGAFVEAKNAGTAIVFATHEEEATRHADRLFRMAGGRLAPLLAEAAPDADSSTALLVGL
ncbi:MAG: ATP-binding cassette domain-containing protein, partial [Planctomycetota bacterium]|nr:ATP-binding cassette domain-containing protein [Planctomycetota bacterium]